MKQKSVKHLFTALLIGWGCILCGGFTSNPVCIEPNEKEKIQIYCKKDTENKESLNEDNINSEGTEVESFTKQEAEEDTEIKKDTEESVRVVAEGTAQELSQEPEESVRVVAEGTAQEISQETEESVRIVAEGTVQELSQETEESVRIVAEGTVQEISQEITEEPVLQETIETIESQPETRQTDQEELPAIKQHSLNYTGYYEERVPGGLEIVNQLRSGNPVFSSSSSYPINIVLGTVLQDYCGIDNSYGLYYTNEDNTYEIAESVWPILYNSILQSDQGWQDYTGYVYNACSTLNLECSDYDLVNQINNYICANFDYLITNQANMPNFISTGYGQCWHYAKLFADMCNCVGIECYKVETTDHAWNEVIVEGVRYKFDCTYNDTTGDWNSYSWLTV